MTNHITVQVIVLTGSMGAARRSGRTADELARIRAAIPGSNVVVCRLTATVDTMQRRLRTREPGMLRQTFVARARELDEVLERARLEHFCVSNDGRPVTDVAAEVLKLAGWP